MAGDSIHQIDEHSHQLFMKKAEDSKDTVYISFRLDDKEAEIFNDYKKLQFLKNNAEAARKLMFERLHQVIEESASDLKQSDARGARELVA